MVRWTQIKGRKDQSFSFTKREESGRLYKAFAGNCQPRGIISHQNQRNSASSSLEIESAGYADMAETQGWLSSVYLGS